MRLSIRPKLSIILSLVTLLTVIGGFMVVAIASHGPGAHAASASNQVSGKLAAHTLKRGGQAPASAASQTDYTMPGHASTASTNGAAAPSTSGEIGRAHV